MKIDAQYKRRIRIQCNPNTPHGRSTTITDLETGEEITNIQHIDIRLNARELNIAHILYSNDKDGVKKATLNDVELDISALEIQ